MCAVGALGIPLVAILLEMVFPSHPFSGVCTIVGLMLGTACAANVFVTPGLKIAAVLIYIPSLLTLLVYVGLCIACARGNCI